MLVLQYTCAYAYACLVKPAEAVVGTNYRPFRHEKGGETMYGVTSVESGNALRSGILNSLVDVVVNKNPLLLR